MIRPPPNRRPFGLAAGLLLGLGLPTAPLAAEAAEAPDLGVRATAELGFLGVADHIIQLSNDGSVIDYRRDAGQDVLFPFARLRGELRWRDHLFTLLYQPLDIETEAVPGRDLRIDGETFPAGEPMRFRYGFSFWRAGWLKQVLDRPHGRLSVGAALQIRNATINFAALDGSRLRSTRDIGPVPLLSLRGRWLLPHDFFVEGEADGIYAPVSVLNGSTTEITGALLDASLRAGLALDTLVPAELFLNLRHLGGGAVGTSDPGDFGDGYVRNWLYTWTLSLGLSVDLR